MEDEHKPWRFNSDIDGLPEPDREWIELAIEHFEAHVRPLNEQERKDLFAEIYNECDLFLSYDHLLKTAPRQKTVTKWLRDLSQAAKQLQKSIRGADHFTLLELYRARLEDGPAFKMLKGLGFNELTNWRTSDRPHSLLLSALDELAVSAERAANNQEEDPGGHGSLLPGNATWDLCVGCAGAFEILGAEEHITGSINGTFGTFVTYVLSAAKRTEANSPEKHIKLVAQKYRHILKAHEDWRSRKQQVEAPLLVRVGHPEENFVNTEEILEIS